MADIRVHPRTGERFIIEDGEARPAPNPLTSGLLNVANAVAFQYGDELVGAISADARENMRQTLADYEAAYPGQATATEVAGAVGGGLLVPGGWAGQAVTRGGQMARLAGQAALEGAVYGFGEGSGDAGDRLTSAATEAAVSTLGAGAFGIVGEGVSALRRGSRADEALRTALGDLDPEALMREGVSAADINRTALNLADAASARVTKEQPLIDALEARSKGKAERLRTAMIEETGADPLRGREAITETLQGRAAPLYEEANAAFGRTIPEDLQATIDDIESLSTLRDRMAREARDAERLGGVTDEMIPAASEDLGDRLTYRGLHRMQSEIRQELQDDALARQRTGKGTLSGQQRKNLSAARQQMLEELDAQSPAYLKARALYAGGKQAEQAFDTGRQLLTAPASEAQRIIADLEPDMRLPAQQGFMEAVSDTLKDSLNTGQVSGVLRDQRFAETFASLFPDATQAARVQTLVEDAVRQQETFRTVQQNSRTAQREAAQEQLTGGRGKVLSFLKSMLAGNRLEQAGEAAQFMQGANDEMLDKVLRLTISTDPAEKAELLRILTAQTERELAGRGMLEAGAVVRGL